MRNIDLFDDYLNGRLNTEDKQAFEQQANTDAAFSAAFNEHKKFLAILKEQQEKEQLKNKLNRFHREAFGSSNTFSINDDRNFYKKYIKPVSVAASVAIIAVIATVAMLSLGGYLIKNQNQSITELYKKVERLENNDKLIINKFNAPNKKKVFAPANYEGTGFAINTKGYFITSLHMVKGADSVFVENKTLERSSAQIVYTDARLDLAILKLSNADFLKGKEMPWAFKSAPADLGEKVFTLGYPNTDIVYGEGAIASASGSGDTAMYQISIPVNPGNSGGPLLDEQGNIIGLIRGKNSNAEGTGFAIKAAYIAETIKKLEDKELKEELTLPKRNAVKQLKRSEQIKRLEPFIFNVKIYKVN